MLGFGKSQKADHQPVDEFKLGEGRTYPIAARVDCMGDSCPRPQLMTKKAILTAPRGSVVETLVDNATSMEALPPMCPSMGATHLQTIKKDRGWAVYIRKD